MRKGSREASSPSSKSLCFQWAYVPPFFLQSILSRWSCQAIYGNMQERNFIYQRLENKKWVPRLRDAHGEFFTQ
jgi:hypothetical protein